MQNFSSFDIKMCKLIIKIYFVTFKINLDIILSKLTFDYGAVKR